MADKTLKVNISASDNASSVLAKIGNAAKTLGTALEETGQAGDSLEKVSASAAKMGPAIEKSASQGAKSITSLKSEIKNLDSEISTVAKTMAGMGSVLTAAITVPMAAGTKAAWGQVDAVQRATVALRVYERDAAKVDQVLSSLVAYARSDMGVLFQREDLFQAATALRVMGAETDKLVGYVEIMSRSVATGAGNWAELEQVIGRVGSTGQLTGVEFDNLTKMGFQLDDSLRNTVVTWDELFSALGAGIPGMGDALNTIEGQTIRLSSAFRGLGIEILQIDKDTSQFIEGGFGDQLYQGIGRATELIKAMAPAASVAGDGLAILASGATKVVDVFLALPAPVQTAIVGLTGISGIALTAGGAFLFMLPKILESAAAFRTLRQSTTIMSALSATFNPLTLGIAAVAAAGIYTWSVFQDGKQAVQSLDDAFKSLSVTASNLRLSGDDEAAGFVDQFKRDAEEARLAAESYHGSALLIDEARRRASESGDAYGVILGELQEGYSRSSDEAQAFAAAQSVIGAAFEDSRVDHAALSASLMDLRQQYRDGTIDLDGYDAGVIQISGSLDQFRLDADAAGDSLDGMGDSATGLGAALKLLQGKTKGFIDELMQLNTVTDDDAFGERLLKTIGLDAAQRGQVDMTLDTIRQLNTALGDMPGPGAEQSEWLDWINQANAGSIEHQRRIEAANTARRDEAQSLVMAASGQTAYATATDAAGAALEASRTSIDANREAIIAAGVAYQEFIDRQTEYIDQLRTLAGMDDALSLSATVSDLAAVANAAQDASSALDTVFRVIVGNTNTIGSQVAGVEKWALELINVRGEYGKIDDLLAANVITLGQYNDAQAAQETISASNAAIQQDILTIQAKQAPLIAEHTAALETQMGVIAGMPAHQQLVALGWMDATTAGRAFEFQQLAIEAASGRMGAAGEHAFNSYITGAAQADPALKALLVDMGLISEGADGTITVNGVEGAQSEMSMLTDVMGDLVNTLREINGLPPIDIKVNGKDDVDAVSAALKDLPDVKNLLLNLQVPDGAGGGLSGFLNSVLGRNGADTPAVDVPVDLTLDEGAIEALRASLQQEPVRVPVELDLGGLGGTAAGGAMGMARSALGSVQQSVTVTVDAIDNASPVIGDVISLASSVDGYTASVNLGAVDNASLTIGDVISFMASINGYTSTMNIAATDGASPVIGDAVSFLSEVDGYESWMSINAVDNATGVIADAVSFLSSVDGYSATMTLNMVTSTSTGGARHGGIPGFSHGGIPVELAEAGPELLHLATGGTVPIYERGVYNVPPNTYVSPANANPMQPAPVSGDTYEIHIHGNVYGIDDLADALAASASKYLAGFGGGS